MDKGLIQTSQQALQMTLGAHQQDLKTIINAFVRASLADFPDDAGQQLLFGKGANVFSRSVANLFHEIVSPIGGSAAEAGVKSEVHDCSV